MGKYINFNSSNVIDIEKLPGELNEILGYERFPITIVNELLQRLKREKIVSYDKHEKRYENNIRIVKGI